MALLIFSPCGGPATALSPCVLPVLPIALSAGATGGRRRPLGDRHRAGALVHVRHGRARLRDRRPRAAGRLPAQPSAIAGLLAFGVALLVPMAGRPLEASIGRLAPQGAQHQAGNGEGFGSGLAGGPASGLYTPCAGPILACIITLSALPGVHHRPAAAALAYAMGRAVVLYALMLGGRRLTRRLSRRSGLASSMRGWGR